MEESRETETEPNNIDGGFTSKKGSACSQNGKKYELEIYNVVKKCKLMNGTHMSLFNAQSENELGGCNSKNDIICKDGEKEIPIEIKKLKTPDWMQCSLHFVNVPSSQDTSMHPNKWKGSETSKIPNASKLIFEELLETSLSKQLFNGKIPPFMERNITHEEWIKIKKETNDFNDIYIDCPSNTIARLYKEKGCKYIQISDRGLFHLGEDVCKFGVPEFICEQQLRIRTKIHTRKNSHGFCKLSVMIACQPKNNKAIELSPFSLDAVEKLPKNLIFYSHL